MDNGHIASLRQNIIVKNLFGNISWSRRRKLCSGLFGRYFITRRKEPTKPAKLEILDDYNVNLTISEGRYHQVKRMFAALGNKVVGLHRWKIGDVVLDESLEEGEYRPLTQSEIEKLVK